MQPVTTLPPRADGQRDGETHNRRALHLAILFGVAFLVLVAILRSELDGPPLWDAVWSSSAGAAELSRNGFDYPELLAQPGFRDGGPGSHAPSLVTPILGFFFVLFGSEGGLIGGHIFFVVLGAGLATATFALARRFLELRLAVLVAAATVLLPVVLQQIADPYLELPLALFLVLAVIAFLDRDRARVAFFAALAVWVKPTGLILLPVIALMGDRSEPRRWLKNAATGLVAVLPFYLQLAAPSITTEATGLEPTWEATWLLLRSGAASLVITTDVFLIVALLALTVFRRRSEDSTLVRIVVLLSAAFLAMMLYTIVASQGITILPRYYVALLPLWLILVTLRFQGHSSNVAAGFLSLLIAFSLFNFDGRYYPQANHHQPWLAERSVGGASDFRELMIDGTRILATEPVDLLIVWRAEQFRFKYPELGFVEREPENYVSIFSLPDELPDTFAWLNEPHSQRVDNALEAIAKEGGWSLDRRTIHDGRWRSEIVVASRN